MVKLKTLYLWIIFFISLILSYFVANRPENITADYGIYYTMYNDPDARLSELTFNFFRYIFSGFDNGFIYLLYAYAFLSLFIKLSILIKQNFLNFLLFLIFYFLCFFPLWEMTQIRISLAVSIFILSFFYFPKYRDLIVLSSLLFHYSMIFIVAPYFLYKFFGGKIYLSILSNFALGIVFLFIVSYTPYVAYDANEYVAEYSFFSLKNVLILFLIIYNYKNNYFENYYIEASTVISLSIFIHYYVIGYYYPTIVIRLMDICIFLLISSLIFSRNSETNVFLKIFITSLVVFYYFNINYVVDSSLVNTDLFFNFFKNFF